MNRKTTKLIPVFAAVFALMFTVATPLAMAEFGEERHAKEMGQKYNKMHKVIKVDGFVGSIQIDENSDRQSLKEQVSVSLSEAADGLDVMGGHIGVVVNEEGNRYMAWTLKSVEKNSESETVNVTIHVVDAADSNNTAEVHKEVNVKSYRK